MWTNEKQILITTESREVIVIRRTGGTNKTLYCPNCKTAFAEAESYGGSGTAETNDDWVHRYVNGDGYQNETDQEDK